MSEPGNNYIEKKEIMADWTKRASDWHMQNRVNVGAPQITREFITENLKQQMRRLFL